MTDVLLVVVLLSPPAWRRPLAARGPADGPARRRGRTTRAASVSVVVPARDEEATLPGARWRRCAARRRRPRGRGGGRRVPGRDGRGGPRRAAPACCPPATPPPGWTGKAWACHLGAGATSGDLLLFLDADTVLAPDALGGLLELHARHGGLVSVQPFHRVVRPYEQLSSYFNVVALMASGAFSPSSHASRPMAFGPCLLTSRADYESTRTAALRVRRWRRPNPVCSPITPPKPGSAWPTTGAGGLLPQMSRFPGANACALAGHDIASAPACRAFVIDHPWSAAFVSYVMTKAFLPGFKTVGDAFRLRARRLAAS